MGEPARPQGNVPPAEACDSQGPETAPAKPQEINRIAWLDPAVSPERFWQLIGEATPFAACLVGPRGEVLAATEKFAELIAPFRRLKPGERFLLEEAFLAADILRLQFPRHCEEPCQLRLRDHRPMLVYSQAVSFKGLPCHVFLISKDTERLRLEHELREQLQRDKERVFKAVRCTLRVYELHEKVRRIPTLTRELLQVGDEDLLYEEAGRILQQEGMDLREVTFLILEDRDVVVKYSTNPDLQNARFPVDGDSKYAYLFRRGGSAIDPWSGGVFVLPLRGRENLIGLMEVAISEDARRVFAEDHKVSLSIYDSLLTVADIIALVVESIRLYRKLKHRSQTDPLTGLYNRNYLMREIQKEINRSRRFQRPLSLLFVDVDNLKQLNDKLGHLHVDIILSELAKLLSETFRKTDCVSRYGGDEFVILLPETDLHGAEAKGQELCRRIAEYPFPAFSEREEPIRISVSCGAASYRPPMSADAFLELADQALYRAKESGKNRVAVVERPI